MQEIFKLAEYGPTGVSIALIIAIVYIVCKIMPRFMDTIDANTKATLEMHEFLRNLNGKLRRGIKAN